MSTKNNFNNSDFSFFLFLIFLNFIGISLAVIFYNDKFLLLSYPFSYAGDAYTYQTLSINTLSSYIYSIDMFLSGFLMLYFSYRRFQYKNDKNSFWFLIPFLCGAGFLIAGLSPDDIRHTFHVIGSALLVATLWLMATSYLLSIRKFVSEQQYYFWQVVLQLPVFAYAITYFAGLDFISSVLQKIAIAGLFSSLLYATYSLRKLSD